MMKKGLFFSLQFIGTVGLATALPLVVFAFLGRYLDKLYGSSPKFIIISIFFSAIISFLMLRKIVKKAIDNINKFD